MAMSMLPSELTRLIGSGNESTTASELSTSGSESQQSRDAAFDRENEILQLKSKVEGTLLTWTDEHFDKRSPKFDFQERFRETTSRRKASAPPRMTAAKSKKRPAEVAVGAPVEIAAPARAPVPAPVFEPPPRPQPPLWSPGGLAPLAGIEYDFAPLPDGTAVMLWREYVDEEGIVRQVPLEGRPGWRADHTLLAPGWNRAVTIDGVHLVASRIQCGWARICTL